jgi:hypothetical protein
MPVQIVSDMDQLGRDPLGRGAHFRLARLGLKTGRARQDHSRQQLPAPHV